MTKLIKLKYRDKFKLRIDGTVYIIRGRVRRGLRRVQSLNNGKIYWKKNNISVIPW